MFDHLLKSSRRYDSNKWSNIGFGEEIGIIEIKISTYSGALNNNSCATDKHDSNHHSISYLLPYQNLIHNVTPSN